MVRWIQEQMGGRGVDVGVEDHGEGGQRPGPAPEERQSMVEEELSVQKLVDNLSNAALKERMLLSIAQMSDQSDRQTLKTRAFLKLASEFYEIHQLAEKKQQQEAEQLLSEEARLRKALALKSTIFRAFVADQGSPTELPKVMAQVEPLSDSCQIPTLVS